MTIFVDIAGTASFAILPRLPAIIAGPEVIKCGSFQARIGDHAINSDMIHQMFELQIRNPTMLTQDQIEEWNQQPKPDEADVHVPWMVVDCFCIEKQPCACSMCDGAGWYFRNADTRDCVSPMMQDAMDRHG